MFRRTELGFAVVAVAVAVACLGVALVAAGPGDRADETATAPDYELDLPEEPDADGVAVVDGERYDSAQAAVDAAAPGDTVVLAGHFDERVAVATPDVTVVSAHAVGDGESLPAADRPALIDGGGEGRVVEVRADDVTLEGLWVRDSGYDPGNEDAAVFVDGNGTTVRDSYLTEVTFGVWVDGVDDATIEANAIAGRESVETARRGNGVQLWETDGTVVRDNEITAVRDGIYYSWAEDVRAEGNVLWNLRYGVHYMYSNDNVLVGNLAFDNDVGYALMVSENLTIEGNAAIDNRGESGHGVFVKEIERSEIRGNTLAGNANGLFVYNAQDNVIADNLVTGNAVGIHSTADSNSQAIYHNSVADNDVPAYTTTTELETWNGTDRGNYWGDARTVDLDGDGTSEVRHRPAGAVERVVAEQPGARAFAESPAFDAVRTAESSFPAVESPGVVDHHPLDEPRHDLRSVDPERWIDRDDRGVDAAATDEDGRIATNRTERT